MSQTDKIFQHLKKGNSITQDEAKHLFGINRLASRINDLKNQGMPIRGQMITVKNRFGEECSIKQYWLDASKLKNIELIKVLIKARKTYPEDHNQVAKINQQIDKLC